MSLYHDVEPASREILQGWGLYLRTRRCHCPADNDLGHPSKPCSGSKMPCHSDLWDMRKI